MRSLSETLSYEHPGVLEKLVGSYGLSQAEAEDLFLELKRWLWLLAVNHHEEVVGERPPLLGITPSLRMLDEAWHAFILFTRDYSDFCAAYCGAYIHHQPAASAGGTATVSIEGYQRLLEYVLKHLGRETLIKWYGEYQRKYAGLHARVVLERLDGTEPGAQAAE